MWPMLLLAAVKSGTEIYKGFKEKHALDQNAELMREQGREVQQQYYDQAANMAQQGGAFLGQQTSAFANSGVKVDEGSPLAVINETRKNLQKDISRTQQLGNVSLKKAYNQANEMNKQGQDIFNASLLSGTANLFASAYKEGFFDLFKTPEVPVGSLSNNSFWQQDDNPWQGQRTTLSSNVNMFGNYEYPTNDPLVPNKRRNTLDIFSEGYY